MSLTQLRSNTSRLLLGAALLHLVLAISIQVVGKYRLFPQTFDSNGIGISFALDSVSYHREAVQMARLLRSGDLRDWYRYQAPLATFQARLYSISLALLAPILGEGILAIEPINLFFYLSLLTLTYLIGAKVFSAEVGRIAAILVGLWPSLLIFSTQLLRDSYSIFAFLMLIYSLILCLSEPFTAWRATLDVLAAFTALLLIMLGRPTMWEIVTITVLLGSVFCFAAQVRARQFDLNKTISIVLICIAVFILPRMMPGRRASERADLAITQQSSLQLRSDTTPWSRAATQIGWLRRGFITRYRTSGSNIDNDVQIQNFTDLIKYTPRAIEIGLFAPFPRMWVTPGKEVGLMGRLIVGAEMVGFYILLGLTCVAVTRLRKQFVVWLLFTTGLAGCVLLAFVVVNMGALHRLRYPYFILFLLLGVAGYVTWRNKNLKANFNGAL